MSNDWSDFPEKPACLCIPQAERNAFWKGRKLTIQGKAFAKLDKAELKIRHQLEREQARIKAEKTAERLAFLKERYSK